MTQLYQPKKLNDRENEVKRCTGIYEVRYILKQVSKRMSITSLLSCTHRSHTLLNLLVYHSNSLQHNNCYLFFLSHCTPPNKVSNQNSELWIKILLCYNEVNDISLENCVPTFLKNSMHKIQTSLQNQCIYLGKYYW